MENHHSSAAPLNAKGASGSSGCPENKDIATPNLSSAVEVSVTVTTSNDKVSKGKNVAADNKEELKPHIFAERKRQTRIRDYYGELEALIPQIPEKSGKATILGHVIDYIRSLEKTKAMLEKRKQEWVLARQADAESMASSSSAPPQTTALGMALAAMSPDVPDGFHDDLSAPPLQPLPAALPVPAPQLLPATISSDVPQPLQQPAEPAPSQYPITAVPVGFQWWASPDLAFSVSNDNAYINVCAARYRGMWTMVMVLSVLNKYGIDVVTVQVDSDSVRSMFSIYASVTAMGGENPSALEVYQLAVSEILVWLTTR